MFAWKFFETNDALFTLDVDDHDHLSLDVDNHHQLPWEMILVKARSISNLAQLDHEKAAERCCSLLKLMESANIYECTKDIKNELLGTKFLPSQPKPDFWPFHDHCGDSIKIEAPNKCFGKQCLSLASVTKPICKFDIGKSLLRFLGLNKLPPFETVKQQLVDLNLDLRPIFVDEKLQSVLHDIYDYLNKSSLSIKLCELHQMRLVYSVNFELVIPELIYINFPQEISPYMFQLSKCIASNEERMKLMIKLGVKEMPSHADILKALCRMQRDYSSTPITNELLKSILHWILPCLLQFEALNKSSELVLYLPDIKGVLRRSTDLHFKDVVWLPAEPGINYCHSDIPPNHCIALGVLSAREKYFILKSKGIPYKPFGQHKRLALSIKNLLTGYRSDKNILNELLQNADDAGATEVIFILDTRCHGDEKVFSDEWKDLQGPALLVCNDAPFKVNDLEGIQLLGKATKSTNALQTGKYGVGFNAVYQITDCPMLLASIAEGGDVFCVFDPNLKYVVTSTEDKPGVMIENARQFIEPFTDLKDALLIDKFDSNGKTLFRFPLRNEKMAKVSHLSSKVVNADGIEKMFKKFEKHFSSILLFLKHVTKLTLKTIAVDAESVLTVSVQPYDTSLKKIKNFQKSEHRLADKLGNVTALMNFEERLNKFVCIRQKSNKLYQSYHWNVIEQVGFSCMDQLPSKITELIEKNELFLLPKGGVAVRTNKKCKTCESKCIAKICNSEKLNGLVFCCLPLPISFSLPVIINGNFVLECKTRRCLSLNSLNYLEVIWNETIIQNCIVPCYLDYLISYASKLSQKFKNQDKQKRKKEKYYKLFPQNVQGKYSSFLKRAFFQTISEFNYQVLLVSNGKNDQLKVDMFSKHDFLVFEVNNQPVLHAKSGLLAVLQRLYIPCDVLPDHIQQGFIESDSPLKICSPETVREKLCELTYKILPEQFLHWNVEETVFQEKKNVEMVLKYCLIEEINQQKNFRKTKLIVSTVELKNLPLCLCADGGVTRFSEDNQKFLSEHSDLFIDMSDKFLDKSIVSVLSNYRGSKYFIDFTIDNFVEFLPTVLPKKQFHDATFKVSLQGDKITCCDLSFSLTWFTSVWKFITEHINQKNEIWKKDGIKRWSLIIATSDSELFVLPLKESKQVLLLNEVSQNLNGLSVTLQERLFQSVFVEGSQISFSYLNDVSKNYIYPIDTARKLFGCLENPSDLINALTLSLINNKWKDINKEEAITVLKHFHSSIKDIKSDISDNLKALPLFLTIDDDLVTLKSKESVLVTDEVIFDGLRDFLQDIVLLKYIDKDIELFYKSLGTICVDTLEFYQHYVFPNFNLIDDNSLNNHLFFIKRSLTFLRNPFQWIRLLKVVKFVKTLDGKRSVCSELYDPTNDLFSKMLPREKFPMIKSCSTSWRENENNEWLSFLIKNGLVTKLSEELFILFAREIEKSEDLKLFQVVSEQLVKNMHGMFNKAFYEKLKKIKFLVSSKMSPFKETVYPSINSTCQKMCFEGSASRKISHITWTTMAILPKYVGLFEEEESSILQVKTSICGSSSLNCDLDIEMVVKHIKNITSSKQLLQRSKTCKLLPLYISIQFRALLNKLYKSLDSAYKNGLNITQQLQEMSVVLVLKNSCLEIPTRASLFEEKSISPYLNPVDVSLDPFFDFFKKIGCHCQPSASAYVQVLNSLADDTKGNTLHPNDVKIASSAMHYLSEMLSKESMLSTVDTLYLPTYSFNDKEKNSIHLTLSSNIIAMTDFCLAERLKGFQEPILFNNQKQPGTGEILMKYLPVKIRPKTIRETIKEEIVCEITPINVPANHISKDINRRLKAPEFLSALQRRVQHEFISRAIDIDVKKTMEKVKKDLQHVNVTVLSHIETKLRFLPKNTLIEESNATCNLFLCKSENEVNLYLSLSLKESDLAKTVVYLADAIMEQWNVIFKSSKLINVLPLIIQTPLESLSSTLDEFKIYRDFLSVPFCNKGSFCGKNPSDPILLLRNKFLKLKIEEDIALDVGYGSRRKFINAIRKSKLKTSQKNSVPKLKDGSEEVPKGRQFFELIKFDKNANPTIKIYQKRLILMTPLIAKLFVCNFLKAQF